MACQVVVVPWPKLTPGTDDVDKFFLTPFSDQRQIVALGGRVGLPVIVLPYPPRCRETRASAVILAKSLLEIRSSPGSSMSLSACALPPWSHAVS